MRLGSMESLCAANSTFAVDLLRRLCEKNSDLQWYLQLAPGYACWILNLPARLGEVSRRTLPKSKKTCKNFIVTKIFFTEK
ncbi:hypothetical protein EK904_010785 [Melospiza melodia maxima]|nr:hypothetical protein EK904_010785 [Melospiza melodia maxima]